MVSREQFEAAADETLAARIRAGDRSAENEVVRRYSGRILAMMLVRVRDREAAAELVDDVLMATVAALRGGTVRDTARLGAFIHGTALHVASSYLRSRSRQPRTEPLEEEVIGCEAVVDEERDNDLRDAQRCVATLATQDQRILLMTLVEGLKPGEIAARLGMADDVVRQRKSRAMRVVREMLAAESRNPSRGPL